jgi:hypothetical protein
MAVKAKAGSGSTARTMRKVRDGTPQSLHRGRPPKNAEERPQFMGEYERNRIAELASRAALYQIKIGKIQGDLLAFTKTYGSVTCARNLGFFVGARMICSGRFGKPRPTLVWCLLCPLASMVPVLWR